MQELLNEVDYLRLTGPRMRLTLRRKVTQIAVRGWALNVMEQLPEYTSPLVFWERAMLCSINRHSSTKCWTITISSHFHFPPFQHSLFPCTFPTCLTPHRDPSGPLPADPKALAPAKNAGLTYAPGGIFDGVGGAAGRLY